MTGSGDRCGWFQERMEVCECVCVSPVAMGGLDGAIPLLSVLPKQNTHLHSTLITPHHCAIVPSQSPSVIQSLLYQELKNTHRWSRVNAADSRPSERERINANPQIWKIKVKISSKAFRLHQVAFRYKWELIVLVSYQRQKDLLLVWVVFIDFYISYV